MAEHCGYVVCVEKLRPHPNADRLQIATFFGNDTCVGLDVVVGQKGIYFPSDLQLSVEFCDENHMCRTKADGTADTGYLERDKRNIKAIRLRGEKSDGIFVPIAAIVYTGVNLDELNVGDKIEMLNGHEICCKYIPRCNVRHGAPSKGNKTRKKKVKINLPHFTEHIDTPQLMYNMDMFRPGDLICLTEKVHGTSSRNANTLQISYKKNLFHKLFNLKGKKVEEYKYVVGTRRTVLESATGGYYGTNEFRLEWANKFKDKLMPGECVFGEIAGFIAPGRPIMAKGNNKKT